MTKLRTSVSADLTAPRPRRRRVATTLLGLGALTGVATVAALTGCNMKMQQVHGTRNSGQSRLMDDTFAGQNACNPDDHTRPFIIEWDATDMSSFESLASSDIVVVKYEGCKLRVLDACKNDSIRGSQGAYKPPEWTSGSLETIDIHNEGELYAKLPLGSASLGGRVSGGEQFHMEYFVAGTVYATRDAVYTGDIKDNPGCADATHFVYAYNLGAFALGSMNETATEAGGSVYGFGAGGKTSSGRKAEKKGGDLTVCRAEDATEVQGCTTPIRLNLREIYEGESPEVEAMAMADTADSMSAAAIVNTKVEMSEEARAHLETAFSKFNAGDGKGCLKELDAHDKLDPNHKSTDPSAPYSSNRAFCLMKSGKCDAGKQLYRKYNEANTQMSPEQINRTVDALAGMHCQGDDMAPRDALLASLQALSDAAYTSRKDVAFCDEHYKKVKKLMPKVKPRDEDDTRIHQAPDAAWGTVPLCYQRAGNCKKARAAWEDLLPPRVTEGYSNIKDPQQLESIKQSNFESSVRKCAGK